MPKNENRNLRISKQIRMEGEGAARKITGYAAVYNSMSLDLGGFREIIRPGAFAGTLTEDVRALLNHDSNIVLGRTTAGTLKLAEDDIGLRFECDLSDSQLVRDMVVIPMERGDISQCSFAFYIDQPEDHLWRESREEGFIHEVLKARIDDVSVVTYPAYPATSADVRSALQRLQNPASGQAPGAESQPRQALRRRELELAERVGRFL
jgi:HK97 family phage prohead protease